MNRRKFIKIGEYLRRYREQTKMNQTEFAKKCNINPVQYRRYENNTSFPRDEQLEKIFKTLRDCGIKNELDKPVTIDNFMEYRFRDTVAETESTQPDNGITLDLTSTSRAIIKAFEEIDLKNELLNNFSKANYEGKRRIVLFSDDIASNPKYKKEPDD